jgi:primase-polymerase (primpol)-like protein
MAFYTQDPEQLDKLLRSSALFRPEKWGRQDYRQRTIQRALSNLTETYNTPHDGARMVIGRSNKAQPPRSVPYRKGRWDGRKRPGI